MLRRDARCSEGLKGRRRPAIQPTRQGLAPAPFWIFYQNIQQLGRARAVLGAVPCSRSMTRARRCCGSGTSAASTGSREQFASPGNSTHAQNTATVSARAYDVLDVDTAAVEIASRVAGDTLEWVFSRITTGRSLSGTG